MAMRATRVSSFFSYENDHFAETGSGQKKQKQT
jgi:hypothetical protein